MESFFFDYATVDLSWVMLFVSKYRRYWSVNINNSNKLDSHSIQFSSLQNSQNITINQDTSKDELMEIKDYIQISEDGLINHDLDNYTFNKIEVSFGDDFQENLAEQLKEDAEWAMIGSAIEYKEKNIWIEENATNDNQKTRMLSELQRSYSNEVGTIINTLGQHLDSFFDSANALINRYSKEEVDDIFDIEKFKGHLADMAIKAKDFSLESNVELSKEDIKEALFNSNTESTQLEHMSFDDLIGVIDYITPSDRLDLVDSLSDNYGEYLAQKDYETEKKIDDMDLSAVVKNALLEVNSRDTEGQMRNTAFGIERKNYTEAIAEYDEELERLLARLRKYSAMLKEIEDKHQVDPDNKHLMHILESEGLLRDQISQLKEEKDKVEKDWNSLDNNKHTITEKDSYKRIRAEYEEEKLKLESQE